MLKLLNRTELLLGIYIALYVAIPANGIDAIFGFNIQVILCYLIYQNHCDQTFLID